jgi:predicted membrane protein
MRGGKKPMRKPANLFRSVNEFIMLLLGALLILIAFTRTVGLPSHPWVMIVIGVIFILWAARAWSRPASNEPRAFAAVRAASLMIVGVLLIAIPLLSLTHTSLLLEIAGAVLVVRGIAGAVLAFREA